METVDLYCVDQGPFEAGTAEPPLVLIHGSDASARDWEYVIPAFAQRRRVIAPSLRGHGRSPCGRGYTVPEMAADVWALLDRLGVERFDLVGHSMGGAVAQQMAVDGPERVCRAVFANTLPSFVTDTRAKRMLYWSRAVLMLLLGPQRLTRALARWAFPDDAAAALRARVIDHGGAAHNRCVYLRSVHALRRWQVTDRLGEIRCPVLVIMSEHDYFSVAEGERFAAALPVAVFTLMVSGYHQLPLQFPARFVGNVLRFFAAHPLPPQGG